jgi:hypothetical protein
MQNHVCPTCDREFPLTEEYFYKHSYSKLGFNITCKECFKSHKTIKPRPNKGEKICSKCKCGFPATEEYFRIKKVRDEHVLYYMCRECEKKSKKEYRTLIPEATSLYNKEYHDKNSVTLKNKRLNKYRENQEILVQKARTYRACQPDKIKEIEKRSYYKNRDACIERSTKRNHATKPIECNLNADQWKKVLDFFNYECAYCGSKERITREHFVPFSKGGEYTINNIIPACKSCNSSKRDKSFDVWYKTMNFYSKSREAKIMKYLGYEKTNMQQLKII